MRKIKDLSGQRFGMLTVIRQAEGLEEKYATWECVCECGNRIIVNTKKLKRGTINDCGCQVTRNGRHGRAAENLEARTFGDLTVLYRVQNEKGRVIWLCRCTCGKEKEVSAQLLKRGTVKNCGHSSSGRFQKIPDVRRINVGNTATLPMIET